MTLLALSVLLTGCGGRAAGFFEAAERVAQRGSSSIDEIADAGRSLREIPPSELDAVAAARQHELLVQLDAQALRVFGAQLDSWAARADATAGGAADDAEQALLLQPRPEFLADLRAAAKDEVKSAVCDELQGLLFPTEQDDEDDSGEEMADKVISALSAYTPRAVRTAVDWAMWGRAAAQRVDQAVTSLDDYPERVDLFASPAAQRAVLAKEKFCDPLPGSGR